MPVAVVTGASAGIGRAAAVALARDGYAVGLLARGEAGLTGAEDEIRTAGGTAIAVPTDVAEYGQVDAAASRVEAELGPIDVWVNDGFASVFAPTWEISAEEFERVTAVSYLGYVHGTLAALHRMRPRNAGTIVQVGSALAYRGIPLQSGYCGSKHAIQGFTESLRCELLHERSAVRVTMVQMPALNTPQFDWVLSRLPRAPQPVPPIYQPEVAARAIVHAARHPERREYWVGASTALTLMANAVVPGILDRYLGRTGFGSQQDQAPDENPPGGNLWEPLDRETDHGAHGRFDRRATARSLQWEVTVRRRLLATTTAAVGAAGLGLRVLRRARHQPR
ncbi:MAG: SDR family oxidoreductase [Nocardioidaceae bacterium]